MGIYVHLANLFWHRWSHRPEKVIITVLLRLVQINLCTRIMHMR